MTKKHGKCDGVARMKCGLARLCTALLFVASMASAQEVTEPVDVADEVEQLEPALSSEALTEEVSSSSVADDVVRREVSSGVMDELDLSSSEITGNQELPKVLYIVPWQKSDPGDLTGKPVNTLLDEVLAPVDRTEFLRQIDYYDEIYGENELSQ